MKWSLKRQRFVAERASVGAPKRLFFSQLNFFLPIYRDCAIIIGGEPHSIQVISSRVIEALSTQTAIPKKENFTMKTTMSLFIAFVSLTLVVGCTSQKPSKSVVKQLVKEKLHKHLPRSYTDRAFDTLRWGTRNLKINSIEIVEWGNFNESQKYWPVKIRIVGSVEAEYSTGFASSAWKDREFDETTDFIFSKDDFGKWKIGT